MAYSTIDDLQKYIDQAELIQLCTKLTGKTMSDAEVTGPINEAIESADAEIDRYLLPRMPGLREVSPVPSDVNRFSCMLALNILRLRRSGMPQHFADEIKAIRAQLVALNSGKMTLAADSAGDTVDEGGEYFLTDATVATDDDLNSDDQRRFTPSRLERLTGV